MFIKYQKLFIQTMHRSTIEQKRKLANNSRNKMIQSNKLATTEARIRDLWLTRRLILIYRSAACFSVCTEFGRKKLNQAKKKPGSVEFRVCLSHRTPSPEARGSGFPWRRTLSRASNKKEPTISEGIVFVPFVRSCLEGNRGHSSWHRLQTSRTLKFARLSGSMFARRLSRESCFD